mmetsp:Transcript_25953/g.83749  ORF Transcript_25953/g.83749 Transcript_25953/m.83749 type:complete len:338 (-) Transcript_25953:23-1036(-)
MGQKWMQQQHIARLTGTNLLGVELGQPGARAEPTEHKPGASRQTSKASKRMRHEEQHVVVQAKGSCSNKHLCHRKVGSRHDRRASATRDTATRREHGQCNQGLTRGVQMMAPTTPVNVPTQHWSVTCAQDPLKVVEATTQGGAPRPLRVANDDMSHAMVWRWRHVASAVPGLLAGSWLRGGPTLEALGGPRRRRQQQLVERASQAAVLRGERRGRQGAVARQPTMGPIPVVVRPVRLPECLVLFPRVPGTWPRVIYARCCQSRQKNIPLEGFCLLDRHALSQDTPTFLAEVAQVFIGQDAGHATGGRQGESQCEATWHDMRLDLEPKWCGVHGPIAP